MEVFQQSRSHLDVAGAQSRRAIGGRHGDNAQPPPPRASATSVKCVAAASSVPRRRTPSPATRTTHIKRDDNLGTTDCAHPWSGSRRTFLGQRLPLLLTRPERLLPVRRNSRQLDYPRYFSLQGTWPASLRARAQAQNPQIKPASARFM